MNNKKLKKKQLDSMQANKVWVLLAQAREAIYDFRRQELSRYGVSPKHAAILLSIHSIDGEVTPAKIARWMGREPHSILGILSRMEKHGLIKRTKDLDRKNMVRIVITEKGHEAYNHSLKRTSVIEAISTLSEDERQQLASYLERIRDTAIKGMPEGYSMYFQQYE